MGDHRAPDRTGPNLFAGLILAVLFLVAAFLLVLAALWLHTAWTS
jgi:hypothetical protein